MNKHEEAREDLKKIHQHCEHYYNANLMNYLPMENVIKYTTSCEATENQLSTCKIERSLNEKMYEELKRDVKRYFELADGIIFHQGREYYELGIKIRKTGNE